MNAKFFFVAGLFSTFASLLEALTDPARYAITYCHLVNETDAYQRFRLKNNVPPQSTDFWRKGKMN